MKTSHIRIIFLILAAVLWTIVGTSCNTVRGVGRDVEHVGGHIERAAS
jgi:predicted small secreted protein